MKKQWKPLLLCLFALAFGLLTPLLWVRAQDRVTVSDEPVEIQQVDLADSSGLTVTEKLSLFADPESSIDNVGVAWHQTAPSLSFCCWDVLDAVLSNGVDIIESATARQESQTALLISRDDRAFLLWEVFFDDEAGTQLYLYIDDETGACLGLRYVNGGNPQDMAAWAFVSAVTLTLNLGLEPSLTEDYAAWVEYRTSSGLAGIDPAKLVDYEGDDGVFSLMDEEGQICTLDIEYGDGWFRVNGSR